LEIFKNILFPSGAGVVSGGCSRSLIFGSLGAS